MAELVKNDKGFKVIKLSVNEASKLGWGISGSGACICMHCNNPILGDIYYPVVLNDTMDKEDWEIEIWSIFSTVPVEQIKKELGL